jgi:uncharacterized membrane-anchored protein
MKNRKRVKQMQKLISGLTKKKYLFRDVTKKKSTNGSEIVSSKIINSIIIEQILKTKKSKIYMLKLLK